LWPHPDEHYTSRPEFPVFLSVRTSERESACWERFRGARLRFLARKNRTRKARFAAKPDFERISLSHNALDAAAAGTWRKDLG
jgi:hypothetical protein